jgi:hypothetical protein
MPEPRSTSDPVVPDGSEKIQTVGQLKEWLKAFSDQDLVLGAFEGQPRRNEVWCRHAQGQVIIEVPRFDPQSFS